MNNIDIAHHRLHNQHLIGPKLRTPQDVVARLGAVQAQDFAGAKWALSMRLSSSPTDDSLDAAFAAGKILRTHVLRPTWHFVTPADIRWMLMLSAPRVHTASGFMYRQLELNRTVVRKSYAVIERSLRGNKQLTRTELAAAFKKAGLIADGLRLTYFMMSAELDGIICSGARRGNQFTYALLEERVAPASTLTRDEALAELTSRYFATRGPATLHDFSWWSGLTIADARLGIELTGSKFSHEAMDGRTYWFPSSGNRTKINSTTAHLLPNYDEYFIGFQDRSAIGDAISRTRVSVSRSALIAHIVTIDGQIVGGWKRTLKKDAVIIEMNLITRPTRAEARAIDAATKEFGNFLGLPVQVTHGKQRSNS